MKFRACRSCEATQIKRISLQGIKTLSQNHTVAAVQKPPQRHVNRGAWLWSSANIKGANKDAKISKQSSETSKKKTVSVKPVSHYAKIYVGRSKTMHNLLLCAHTQRMNYVTNAFLLVCSLVRSKQLLCFAHDQDQKWEQKLTTKTFVGFHNHSSLLTKPVQTKD